MQMTKTTKAQMTFTTATYIAFGLLILLGVGLLVIPTLVTPVFGSMYQEFGGPLPWNTRLIIQSWYPFSSSSILMLFLGASLITRSAKTRWIILSVGFATGIILIIFYVTALYMPIFSVANAIQA